MRERTDRPEAGDTLDILDEPVRRALDDIGIEGQQRRRVMHLTIRERDHARKSRARHIGQGSAER